MLQLYPGDSADIDELRQWCVERLHSLWAPQTMDIVQRLPQTALGKIDKRLLRPKHLASKGASVPYSALWHIGDSDYLCEYFHVTMASATDGALVREPPLGVSCHRRLRGICTAPCSSPRVARPPSRRPRPTAPPPRTTIPPPEP
ncbi:hypothetical protein [Catellatospora methionotrophica]|uniref:hypothetical protein n=1 Tax=Catellatospora methionotrophica TaxID=121620 RepID=UPI0033D5504D